MKKPIIAAAQFVWLWIASDDNPSGVIYGVLAIGTLIAAEGTRRETYASVVGASVLALCLYWLAHAYARHFGDRLERSTQWGVRELRIVFLHEAALLKGACLPVVALALSWLAEAPLAMGINAGLWTAVIELLSLEVLSGLTRKLPLGELLTEVILGVMLGAGIFAVRIVLH